MTQGLEKSAGRKSLPVIKATLWRTNTPGFMLNLPCKATITLQGGFHAVCDGIVIRGSNREREFVTETVFFDWQPSDLVEIRIEIVPDVGDEFQPQWMRDEHYSKLLIHHVDPFEVVPYLVTEFRTQESYWFRAIAKSLEEQGIRVNLEEVVARPGRKRN